MSCRQYSGRLEIGERVWVKAFKSFQQSIGPKDPIVPRLVPKEGMEA